MEHMRIAIVTDDKPYGEALARSLLLGNRNFDLTMLGNRAFCIRCRETDQAYLEDFDLILWDREDLDRVYGGNLIWLTERPPGGQKDGGEGGLDKGADPVRPKRFAIYRYAPSRAMLAQICFIYETLTGSRSGGARPDRVDVFALVSWQGGCGCTTVAMAAAQEISRFERKRCLYLSLEGTESTALYMEMPDGMKTAGEYLYRLTAQTGKSPCLDEYLVKDAFGTEAFAAAPGNNPLGTAGPEEMQRLLPALMDSGRFDCILIDGGSGSGRNLQEILPWADRILLLSSREEPERERSYRTFLGLAAGEDLTNRMIRVRNHILPSGEAAGPAGEGGGPSGERVMTGERGLSISHAPGLLPGSLLEGSFGKDIHKLVDLCYN